MDVGLLITEGTTITTGRASSYEKPPNFHAASALKGWSGVVKATHKAL